MSGRNGRKCEYSFMGEDGNSCCFSDHYFANRNGKL